jgi:serine-type D-Ala-D-Ala carboxypeptidase
MTRIDRMMAKALDDGVFPGAVLRVSAQGVPVYEKAFGVMDYHLAGPVTVHTVYDLASLTKPLATAPAIMLLMQNGALSLSSTLGDLMPEASWGDKSVITVAHLLTHTSGLPDYKPYYIELSTWPKEDRKKKLETLLLREPLVNRPGETVCYSDIGYMILAWIVERSSGMALSIFVENHIFKPLGIDDLYYIRYDDSRLGKSDTASTEDCPWRKKVIRGEVHDDNAWVMGGEAGHAGLFGTACGVDRLLQAFAGSGKGNIFHPQTMGLFLGEWKGTRRTPGFDMPSRVGSSSGSYFTESSVGHLGFTGTSCWMDLERRITVILLTNRIHPSRDNIRIREFRPRIHDCVMDSLGAKIPPTV